MYFKMSKFRLKEIIGNQCVNTDHILEITKFEK